MHKGRQAGRHGHFQSGNAEGGLVKLDFFFIQRVRRMVGGNGVHRAVTDAAQNGLAVGLGA